MPAELAVVTRVIEGRRSSLRIDAARPVPVDLLEQLCRLGARAPNHHLTNPWRFAILLGEARARLGEALADHLGATGGDDAARSKARGKYLRAPAMIAIASCSGELADEVVRREDRDATVAAVQTLLLAAEAAGLAAFWGTGAATDASAIRRLCGFPDASELVALVYVGWPLERIRAARREDPSIRVIGAVDGT